MDRPRPRTARSHRRAYALLGAALAIAAVSSTLALLRAAPPSVSRDAILLGEVRRGPMLRRVQGAGTLQSEHVLWLTAAHAGRVDRILAHPGDAVAADTVILELSNPDLELALLTAEQQRASARAELARQEAALASARLAQQALIARLESKARILGRETKVHDELELSALVSPLEAARTRDEAAEVEARLGLEKQRLEVAVAGARKQIAAQDEQLRSQQSIAAFYRREIAQLKITSGAPGVLQALPLEPGQSVTPGTVLAKLSGSDELKAVLQIPEIQAKDVQPGQEARVDTRNGVVGARVARIDPAAVRGAVAVELRFTEPLPKGARPDLRVDGTIELERLSEVLSVPRPAHAREQGSCEVFKVAEDGSAVRVRVELGRGTPTHLEVLQGLTEGEQVVLSDMSRWDGIDRVMIR